MSKDALQNGHNTWPWLDLRPTMPLVWQRGIVLFISMQENTPLCHLHSWGVQGMSQVVAMQEMVDRMKAAQETTKANLIPPQSRMKEYTDRSRRLEPFFKGTDVPLSTKNLRVDLHLLSKLHR